MTILVDSRTGSNFLYAPLVASCSHKVQLTTLQSGDVAWIGNGPDGPTSIAVEVKRIQDLIDSKNTGRLSGTQLVHMGNHHEFGYILVVGLWQPDAEGLLCTWKGRRKGWQPWSTGRRQYTVKEVYKFLNTLAVECGVHLWRVGTDHEAAAWVSAAYGWWQEPWESHKSHRQKARVGARLQLSGVKQSRLCRALQEYEGIGLDRAEAIAARYGSMGNLLVTGKAEDIAALAYGKRKDDAVLHVGKKTAEKLMEQLWEG